MAFRDFSFPQVNREFGLTLEEIELFPGVASLPVREEFASFIRDGVDLATANDTEKAKSEFIIAPVLLELRRVLSKSFALFSGPEWDVDSSRGLNGYCDFIITRGTNQYVLGTPYVAIVEAKNDAIRSGFGQCIASMFAAQLCDEKADLAGGSVRGIVSTGGIWKFLKLCGTVVTIDEHEYYINDLPKLMGVLREVVKVD